MNFDTHWDVLLQQHSLPCILADLETHEILYLNPEMEILFQEQKNILGTKYEKLFQTEDILSSPSWAEDMFEHSIYVPDLEQNFLVTYIKVSFEDTVYAFIKFQPHESEQNASLNFEMTMSKCINLLQEGQEEKIPALLEILGQFYDADKTCLYQVDRHKMRIPCHQYWKREESVSIVSDLSQQFDTEQLLNWFHTRNEVGVIEADDSHSSFCPTSLEAKVLEALRLNNLVISVVEDHNKTPLAVVAVSNRRNKSADFRLLQAVTRFMEKDITSAEMNLALQQMNDIDILTGFYNRITYSLKMDLFNYNPPPSLGVIFVNINGLKKVNTEFGLAKGDGYIKKVTEIIQNHFCTDFYRISGDEFICFFPKISKGDFLEKVSSLLDKMKAENNHDFALGHAWGEGRVDADDLIKEADTVMYINKQEYYHKSQRRLNDISDSTLSDLLLYLDSEEFMIYLQPQVNLHDNSLYGAEALIRRYDKIHQKMVFPDQFISLYEKKSVIRHVDIFVIEQVCRLLAQLQEEEKAIPISVNLSRVTLLEYGIVDTIARICDGYGVSRRLLVIEVTERVGLIQNNVASSLIMDFKDRGFKISLDDFGCAYSNIVTLAQIEVDEVKLDKSLVDFIEFNEKNQILVKNVLAMCNELKGTSTLAEGIENVEQAKLLHQLGCHLGQGYFYSRPIPVDEFKTRFIDMQ